MPPIEGHLLQVQIESDALQEQLLFLVWSQSEKETSNYDNYMFFWLRANYTDFLKKKRDSFASN